MLRIFPRFRAYYHLVFLLVVVGVPLYVWTLWQTSESMMDLSSFGGDFAFFYDSAKKAVMGAAPFVTDFSQMPAVRDGQGEILRFYQGWVLSPVTLLFVLPLAAFGYMGAYLAWAGVGIVATMLSCAGKLRDGGAPIFFVLAPATLMTLFFGQSTLLLAGFMAGGLRLLERAPATAGFLLGFALIKPEIGLFAVIAVIAQRNVIALCGMIVSGGLLVSVTTVLFGAPVWSAYMSSAPTALYSLLEQAQGMTLYLMPSVFSALRVLGVPFEIALYSQLGVSVLGVLVIFWLYKQTRRFELRNLAFGITVMLSAPLLFCWDLAILTPLLYLYGVKTGIFEEGSEASFFGASALFGAFLVPVIAVGTAAHFAPIAPLLMLTALLYLLVRLREEEILRKRWSKRQSSGQERSEPVMTKDMARP
ncbi:DUF2029 domain-containing protein [Rhodobacteraceae bacterium RKSG542]|uniref:glycosyltransferase family 87 protein n=1 Tax=Pseudovibrio flavus TaxID=2529854 RepID=UPI0012BC55D5|nr:glycosyltransferase family 87 protein [Pseudovibrio flavus]MTI19154.1 DUF2029 domain-containing protein [Pseudovibrio flavus]